MAAGIPAPEEDLGKAQFQEELSRWFESRGIVSDLRSHLRHLMITALQNTQIGLKPIEKTSPKNQAINLIVAEYLMRHGCHYTLSIFTSEVPTLTNFSCVNPNTIKKLNSFETKKCLRNHGFQEKEVEEIFNALGFVSCAENVNHIKAKYLQKNNEKALLELVVQMVVEMCTKLQIRENLASCQVESEKRFLSKNWSLKLVDILLCENIKSNQITKLEEAIFRITEKEIKRIVGEEHKVQMQKLAEREKRIQEYLRQHETEIFQRLTEAEKDLEMRTDLIDEELTDRQRHLLELAMEWSNKHEEIVQLSKNFCNIENENRKLQEVIEELKKENQNLKKEEEKQKEEMEELKNKISSLMIQLKEVTESNAILSERIEVLISRENKEVSINHDHAAQDITKNQTEIPLLWSRKLESFCDKNSSVSRPQEVGDVLNLNNSTTKINYEEDFNATDPPKISKDPLKAEKQVSHLNISDDEDNVSLLNSSSSDEILVKVRKKLQNLEDESNRINKNYLEYKSKGLSEESESESCSSLSAKSENVKKISPDFVFKETKSSQTERVNRIEKNQKPEEKVKKNFFYYNHPAILSEEKLTAIPKKEPTKRQLKNREYFLKNRQLVKEFERSDLKESDTTSSSSVQISSPNSTAGFTSNRRMKKINKSGEDLILLTPLRTTSFYCNDLPVGEKPISDDGLKVVSKKHLSSVEKNDYDCLTLLEETRIKSPQNVKKKLLRQQMLIQESDSEENVIDDKGNLNNVENSQL